METTNELTAERSLEIIRKQIELSRKDTEKNAGTPMIWWGAWVTVTALIVGHLWLTTGSSVWNMLWFAMAIIGWGGMFWMDRKEKKSKLPRTIISKAIGYVWYAFGIFASALPILMYVVAPLLFNTRVAGVNYTPIIILMLGLSTTITGLILHNRWITGSSIVGGLAGTALAYVFMGPYEMLVLAGVTLITLVFPGIMINLQKK